MSEETAPKPVHKSERKDSALEKLRLQVSSVLEQGSGKMNEDALLLGTTRFGVFDGASSLDGYMNAEGKTGGYLASHVLQKVFEESKGSLKETAQEGNQALRAAMDADHIDPTSKESLWSSSVAVVDVDPAQRELEWVQTGDSLILFINADGTHRLLEEDYDHDAAVLTKWKALADSGETDIRPKLMNELVQLRRTANIAYGVMNGEEAGVAWLKSGRESLRGVAHVVLFTDGLIIPKIDPNAPDDFDTFTKLYLEGGLEAVKTHIREIEETDPHCVRYPRFKKSDDIGAIAVRLS